MVGINFDVKIVFFWGEYYELKLEKRYLVKGLIYLVFNLVFFFLGVYFICMIDGSIYVGFNVVLSLKWEGYCKMDFDWGDFIEVMVYVGFWKLVGKYW